MQAKVIKFLERPALSLYSNYENMLLKTQETGFPQDLAKSTSNLAATHP